MLITQFEDDRRPVMVASHERSGTHFTMNSLGACFGYLPAPWVDFDRYQFNINFFHPPTLAEALVKMAGLRPLNLIKTHYDFEFFAPVMDQIGQALDVVYVYRHPADVLASYWRFLHTWDWVEGPTPPTVSAFAEAEPMGQLLRLQYRQQPTMLDRWANQVRGWTEAAQTHPNVRLVRYEDLAGDYETTIRGLGRALGRQLDSLVPPPRGENVIEGGKVAFDPPEGADDREAVAELAWRRHRDLMSRLGYDARLPARTGAPQGA